MKKAVYPGSFDPPTLGHVDILRRAAGLFDEVIVAVGANTAKKPMFSLEERVAMLQEIVAELPNVQVLPFDGLLVNFATQHDASAVIRGLRAVSDFENEFQMALANRTLAPNLETVFLMTSAEVMFVSSSIVKEIASLGGDVSGLVPKNVAARLMRMREGS
ncbi:MAG: pantetheine-phosphate adenylyltransferase [Armatimonadetes bacterium]|nr:MAG: pantetheine-phosphate adenylyltransferase [Armatimonadota bacterium]